MHEILLQTKGEHKSCVQEKMKLVKRRGEHTYSGTDEQHKHY